MNKKGRFQAVRAKRASDHMSVEKSSQNAGESRKTISKY